MSKKYSIVTGYWNGSISWKKEDSEFKKNFFNIWYENTLKYSQPEDIFVINSNSEIIPDKKLGKWIDLNFNLGHVHDLDQNNYSNKKFGGWSLSFILGSYLCYANNTDMIFKEQDCLAFNNWVEDIYLTSKKNNVPILVGKKEHSDNQGLEQSLFYISHNFLLTFVKEYINLNSNDAGPNCMRPEMKFRTILNNLNLKSNCDLPFGYGRSRPTFINDSESFYIQKVTEQELKKLKDLGLL